VCAALAGVIPLGMRSASWSAQARMQALPAGSMLSVRFPPRLAPRRPAS
jgi:hypothetical protein